jgi:hypothetical protein
MLRIPGRQPQRHDSRKSHRPGGQHRRVGRDYLLHRSGRRQSDRSNRLHQTQWRARHKHGLAKSQKPADCQRTGHLPRYHRPADQAPPLHFRYSCPPLVNGLVLHQQRHSRLPLQIRFRRTRQPAGSGTHAKQGPQNPCRYAGTGSLAGQSRPRMVPSRPW